METRHTSWRRTTRFTISVAIMALLGVGFFVWRTETIAAQNPGTRGTISGSVTADRGVVLAFRVKALETVHRISYTVFTNQGRYQIFNLPPGKYAVQVVEEEFDSPVQNVDVKSGETTTANLAVRANGKAPGGAGGRGAAATASYREGQASENAAVGAVEVADFDTVYPPSPAKDVMIKHCFACHGAGYFNSQQKNEQAWRKGVDRMFAEDGRVAGIVPGIPIVKYDTVSAEQKESIIKYLAANFGPGSKRRDLKLDPLVRNEEALSKVVYVQYEFPPAPDVTFSNGAKARRGLHDAFPSEVEPGMVWLSGNGSNSIVGVDTSHPEYSVERRTKEYLVPNSENMNTVPHGLIESKGLVWFTEIASGYLGSVNPKTGELKRYPSPTLGGGPLSLRADSKGNLWYTNFVDMSKLGKLDLATKKYTEIETPVKHWSGYGIIVDRRDRVWIAGLKVPAVLMYDQATAKWTTYPTSNPNRRLTEDSKGIIWSAQHFGNRIARIDPATGKVREYELPLKYGNPYEIWADPEDNLWIDNAMYNSLVRFNPKTEQFTYFPFASLQGHTPKVELDWKETGTMWFATGRGAELAHFKPKGNVPMGRKTSQ